LQAHFASIVPEAIVEAEVAMFTVENEERLLKGNPDFVVDAIDDIDTKVIIQKQHILLLRAPRGMQLN